jgi:hypothetical protein
MPAALEKGVMRGRPPTRKKGAYTAAEQMRRYRRLLKRAFADPRTLASSLRRLWENRFSAIKRAFVRRLVLSEITRSVLNRYYDRLSFQSMERFFYGTALCLVRTNLCTQFLGDQFRSKMVLGTYISPAAVYWFH